MNEDRAELIKRARELCAQKPVEKSADERLYDQRQREREDIRRMERESGGLPEAELKKVNKWLAEPRAEPAPATDWWTLIDARIDARVSQIVDERLQVERDYLIEVVGTALGEATNQLAEQQEKQAKSELKADEVRTLIIELADSKREIRELRSLLSTGGKVTESAARAAH
jgi:hypothetical protein